MSWWMWIAAWVVGIPFWITVAAVLRYYEVSDLAGWSRADIGGSLAFWPVAVPAWFIFKWSEGQLIAALPDRAFKYMCELHEKAKEEA